MLTLKKLRVLLQPQLFPGCVPAEKQAENTGPEPTPAPPPRGRQGGTRSPQAHTGHRPHTLQAAGAPTPPSADTPAPSRRLGPPALPR